MVEDKVLFNALRVWQTGDDSRKAALPGDHLSEDELYSLAEPGGLERAPEPVLEHLSFCAVCQNGWVEWLDSLAILNDKSDTPGISRTIGHGYLKAASASLFAEPVCLTSSCGRFELSVYPELDNPSRGMVTLEVKQGVDELQSCYCVVRDGTSAIILQGFLDDGRLAARVDELAQLDLKTWTVVAGGG